jgi:hypothetical protein
LQARFHAKDAVALAAAHAVLPERSQQVMSIASRGKNRRKREMLKLEGLPDEHKDRKASQLEERERARWSKKWAALLIDLQMPVAENVLLSLDPVGMLSLVTGKRRAAALRQRLLGFEVKMVHPPLSRPLHRRHRHLPRLLTDAGR